MGTELNYLSMWLGLPGLGPSFTIHHVTFVDPGIPDDMAIQLLHKPMCEGKPFSYTNMHTSFFSPHNILHSPPLETIKNKQKQTKQTKSYMEYL